MAIEADIEEIFKVKTKDNNPPDGKRKVYFTCHPEDFDSSFDKICGDIFKTHDCAIYYTKDMTAVIEEQYLANDLGQRNLFVIPVTFKLLAKPNRAMDSDFAYARREGIPVLPIMLEPGIDELYSRQDKFGELQYLNPYSTDVTEIRYEEKLKKFLDSVLISDEMAKRVRAAFDAYIFLSYRKKDRHYANELMRLIHKNPECRDIAIWYDEFLTPGESFNENIHKVLDDSKLFALLVSPNLLEESNYVMTHEYPAARRAALESKITILPAEMEQTDKDALKAKYEDIPDCVDPKDDDAFRERLMQVISKIAISSNDDDPEHNFLIGLAYLDGIDVEVDRERALQLITSAADTGLEIAMRKLVAIHSNSDDQGLKHAIEWQNRILHSREQDAGDDYIDDLWLLSELCERGRMTVEAIASREKLNTIYEKKLADAAEISKYLYKYIQNLYTLAKLVSADNELENQKTASEYLSKALEFVWDTYDHAIQESELMAIADLFEAIAQYVINKSRRFDNAIDTGSLTLSARKLRRVIEKYNRIDLTTWLENNSLFFKAAANRMEIFFSESGLDEMLGKLGNSDADTDFRHDNPLAEAEELLIMSTGIKDHVSRSDLNKYGITYAQSLYNTASAFLSLGTYDAAIETLTLTTQFLQKFEKEFYRDERSSITEHFKLLAEAYARSQKTDLAMENWEICIHLLEEQLPSRQAQLQLSRIYQKMADAVDYSQGVQLMIKGTEMLERLHGTNDLTDREVFELIGCYCNLAGRYSRPELWDWDRFCEYFSKAHELCTEYYDKDKVQASIYLNTLYRTKVYFEDCKTIDSIKEAGTLLNVALNNCKTLLELDSEQSNELWMETLREFREFDAYATRDFKGDSLIIWRNFCAQLIAKYLQFVTEVASESPITLIDHDFRKPFTDYFLVSGQANYNFLNHFRSVLYVLCELFIELAYKRGLVSDELDINEFIREIYSDAIACQKQGYAFQIFKNEQKRLLELVAPPSTDDDDTTRPGK